jgi:hypothetical protein
MSCWQEIDEYIAKAKEQGYHTVLHLGTKGVNYATTVLMQTAIKVSEWGAALSRFISLGVLMSVFSIFLKVILLAVTSTV